MARKATSSSVRHASSRLAYRFAERIYRSHSLREILENEKLLTFVLCYSGILVYRKDNTYNALCIGKNDRILRESRIFRNSAVYMGCQKNVGKEMYYAKLFYFSSYFPFVLEEFYWEMHSLVPSPTLWKTGNISKIIKAISDVKN